MELELGFKISKDLDDYSSADLRISKDRAGPLFVSRETDTKFVLTGILKGYKKEHIQIDINEDGTRIAIHGERLVQEMVMVNWQMRKKDPEMRGFRKVFNIPQGVNLDKIKARFNEDENILTISMPKLVKGLCGLKIEEIIEEEPSQKENYEIVSEIRPSKENENDGGVVEEAKDSVQKENENLVKENDEIVSEISPSKENADGNHDIEETKDNVQNENKNLAKENVEIVSEMNPRKENENGEQVFEEAKDGVQKENENLAKDDDEIVSEISPIKQNENGERVFHEAKDSVQKENENLAKDDDKTVAEISPRKETENGEQVFEEAKDSVHKENEKFAKDDNEIVSEISPRKENENITRENGKIFSEISPSKENETEEQVVEETKDIVSEEIPRMEREKQGLELDNLREKRNEERQSNEKGSKLCVPMIAGTALIASILVFVMHMIRANNAPSKKKC